MFVLAYNKGGVRLPNFDSSLSMTKVWAESIKVPGLNVSEADRKVFSLELIANVEFPPKTQSGTHDNSDDDDDTFTPAKPQSRLRRTTTAKRSRAPSTTSESGNDRPSKSKFICFLDMELVY